MTYDVKRPPLFSPGVRMMRNKRLSGTLCTLAKKRTATCFSELRESGAGVGLRSLCTPGSS